MVLVLIIIVIYLRNEKVEWAKDVVKKGHLWVLTVRAYVIIGTIYVYNMEGLFKFF